MASLPGRVGCLQPRRAGPYDDNPLRGGRLGAGDLFLPSKGWIYGTSNVLLFKDALITTLVACNAGSNRLFLALKGFPWKVGIGQKGSPHRYQISLSLGDDLLR